MRTFGYVRSSRPPATHRDRPGDPTAESPLGVESQRRAILERFPTAEIFEDRFRSGRSATRPGLRSLIDTVSSGDRVVVTRLDRLARDTLLAVHLETEIERVRGARLISLAGEGTNPDGSPPDPTHVFLRRVLAAQAELVAAQTAASTKAALQVRRAAGMSTNGHAPYGWRVAEDGRLVEDDQEQDVLRIVMQRARGDVASLSPADVQDVLNLRGIPNRHGRPWSRAGALRLIRAIRSREAETVST